MNAQGLAELGGWLANHGTAFLFGQPQPADVVGQYWTAARCRLERWSTALRLFLTDLEQPADEMTEHDPWPAMQIVIEEILISELLTRVWSALLVGHDHQHKSAELQGLAHSIHIGHLEARQRAIRTLLKARPVNESAFERLSQLRHRVERWTDLLLAQLPVCEPASAFAFDQARVADFRTEQGLYSPAEWRLRQQLLAASMSADLAGMVSGYPANPELNRQLVSGILACFAPDRFTSSGLPKSARQLWMERAHNDTRFYLDQLVELESRATGTVPGGSTRW